MRSSYAGALDAPTPRGGTVVMQGNHIDCGRRITDSLTGRNATTLNHEHNPPQRPQTNPRRQSHSHPITNTTPRREQEKTKDTKI